MTSNKDIQNPLSDGEFIVDPNGLIIDLSPRTEVLLGRSRSEVIQKGAGSLITFEGFSTRTEEILKSDAVHYQQLVQDQQVIEATTRTAIIKLASKDTEAKIAIIPLMLANDFTLALLFVVVDKEDQTDSLTGLPKTIVIIGDWLLTLWKANTTAVVFLLTITVIILAELNFDELAKVLKLYTPKHPAPIESAKPSPSPSP